MSYVYVQSEPQLYTVGFYDPSGKWHTDSDHSDKESAAARVSFLNGNPAGEMPQGCQNQTCSYFTHYLIWWNPEVNGPKLEHAAYHHAESQCIAAQNRVMDWYDQNPDVQGKAFQSNSTIEALERVATLWEKKVAA